MTDDGVPGRHVHAATWLLKKDPCSNLNSTGLKRAQETADAAHVEPSPPTSCRRGADQGFSIVENVLAVVLVGLIATSLFMALWTLIRVARVNDYQAEVEAVAGGAVDALATVDYQPCPGLGGYEMYAQQGASSIGWPLSTVAVTRVRYWDPYVQAWDDTNPFSVDECSGTVFLSTARTMQLVEVTVTSPDGNYSRSVQTIITDMRNRRLGDA